MKKVSPLCRLSNSSLYRACRFVPFTVPYLYPVPKIPSSPHQSRKWFELNSSVLKYHCKNFANWENNFWDSLKTVPWPRFAWSCSDTSTSIAFLPITLTSPINRLKNIKKCIYWIIFTKNVKIFLSNEACNFCRNCARLALQYRTLPVNS